MSKCELALDYVDTRRELVHDNAARCLITALPAK